MIYAINRRTKEHQLRAEVVGLPDEWEFIEATPDGWIEWKSSKYEGPMPSGAACEIRLSDGESLIAKDAEDFDWSTGGDRWIIAYRPILDAKPEAPEWDGGGLPPVGTMCEFIDPDDGEGSWTRVTVFGRNGHIIWLGISGWGKLYDASLYKFRPIRSEEDKAVEEMIHQVQQAGLGDEHYNRAVCRALYRAGYRMAGGDS